MDIEKIRRSLVIVKEFTFILFRNPVIFAGFVFLAPSLIADKIHEKITGEKLIKPVAREPRKNKDLEKRKNIN